MRYRVLVPAEPSTAIPAGAAILECRRDPRGVLHGWVIAGRDQYGELCAQAHRRGRLMVLPAGCTTVGCYDTIDGELRLERAGIAALERWLGRRVQRGDLQASDNRSDRRARARRLFQQGRYAEAFLIDRRMGL